MWRLDSDGRAANYNNDFAMGSTVVAALIAVIAAAIWLVRWTVTTWGLSGLLAAIIGLSLSYLIFSWAAYKVAQRQWRLAQVKKKMNEAK